MPGLLQNRSQMPQTTHASNGARLVSATGEALPLQSITLTAEAMGGIARTRLRQHFSNPQRTPLELTYAFPLPADGAVAGYEIRAGERLIKGRVEPREKARVDFESARLEGRTAGLVDEERANFFTQRLGNIPAATDVVVELTIDHRLAWIPGGAWEWRFPTVIAPRYLAGEGRVADAKKVTVDVVNGATSPMASISLTIADDFTSAPTSPSHALATASNTVTLAASAPLDRDIVIRWGVAQQEPGLTLRRARPSSSEKTSDPDAAYGLLTIVPPAGEPEAVARDLVLLLDVSGSMSGKPLNQLKAIVTVLIDSLGDSDRLEMVAFASHPTRYLREPVHATECQRSDARAWVQNLQTGGGTEMISAIAEALRPLRDDATRQVVIVTDGQIGFEAAAICAIRDRLPKGSRLHTVGVGSAANRVFLHPAARAGRGVEVMVGLDEKASHGTDRILAATRDPEVVDVTLRGTALLDTPPRLPDLLAGSPVLTGIRLRPEGGTLTITGRTPQGAWEQRVEVPATLPGEGSEDISTLWAREAIENLELDLACGGPRNTIDAQIEAIALRHAIASRLTSWIAASETPSVDPREPVRVERVPQALPYGMSADGLGLDTPTRLEMRAGMADTSVLGAPGALPRRLVRSQRVIPPTAPPPVEQAPLQRREPGELEQLADSLRRPLDEARETVHREIAKLQWLARALEEFAEHLSRGIRRLDVPTREAKSWRHSLLDRLERLVSDAHGTPFAGPLVALLDRLRTQIARFEHETPVQPLMLRGQILPTPSRPTTTIEIFMTSDLNWAPAPSVTLANGSVDVVKYGTTKPGEISAGSLVRVELSAAPDLIARSGQIEIQNGNARLSVRLNKAN